MVSFKRIFALSLTACIHVFHTFTEVIKRKVELFVRFVADVEPLKAELELSALRHKKVEKRPAVAKRLKLDFGDSAIRHVSLLKAIGMHPLATCL